MADHDCPTCGRSFASRRGLGVHHSTAHGERLPNRTCEECGETFFENYEKKYCSERCRDAAVSFEGEDNPNFRDAVETATCAICGIEFEYYPSSKPGLYCSDCVDSESWRTPIDLDGASNPRWKGGPIERDCDICGSTVERYPSTVTGEVVLCSESCRRQWLSEEFQGDGHPNWRGGGSGPYGTGWNEVRRRALERDDYSCVLCGTSRSDLGRNPDVHHILPVRLFIESETFALRDAHTIDNVVTLCPPCHRRSEFGHVSPAELRYRAGIDGTVYA